MCSVKYVCAYWSVPLEMHMQQTRVFLWWCSYVNKSVQPILILFLSVIVILGLQMLNADKLNEKAQF